MWVLLRGGKEALAPGTECKGGLQISVSKRNSILMPYFKTQNCWKKTVMNKTSKPGSTMQSHIGA